MLRKRDVTTIYRPYELGVVLYKPIINLANSKFNSELNLSQ